MVPDEYPIRMRATGPHVVRRIMDLTVTFLIEVAVIVGLLSVLAAGALVASWRRGGGSDSQTGSEERGREAAREPTDRREFFKSTGPDRGDEVKLRLYSPEEYGEEFGDAPSGDFVAALKAYRPLEDVWHELPPGQAANALELSPEDYEVDGENNVLLLRKLPPGLPSTAAGSS